MVTVAKLRELSLRLPMTSLNSEMPPTSRAFKADEDAKAMQIEAGSPAKTVQMRASLDPKLEGELINFLQRNRDMFTWSREELSDVSQEVAEHTLNIKPGSKPIKQGLRRFNQEKR
jgi:hypothetical protein